MAWRRGCLIGISEEILVWSSAIGLVSRPDDLSIKEDQQIHLEYACETTLKIFDKKLEVAVPLSS